MVCLYCEYRYHIEIVNYHLDLCCRLHHACSVQTIIVHNKRIWPIILRCLKYLESDVMGCKQDHLMSTTYSRAYELTAMHNRLYHTYIPLCLLLLQVLFSVVAWVGSDAQTIIVVSSVQEDGGDEERREEGGMEGGKRGWGGKSLVDN